MATKEKTPVDQKTMNATIKEDVFGEESMNATDMNKWNTDVVEDRSKPSPENKLKIAELKYENAGRKQ